MSTLIGAYVCPRGVYCVEVRERRSGVEVVRSFEYPSRVATSDDAARHLADSLARSHITGARIAVVARGFEIGHHTLSLPPAPDKMIAPVIVREVRRLEPQNTDPAVGWLPLPDDGLGAPDLPPQRQFIAAAIPAASARVFETELQRVGNTLHHLTALPAAMQRLAEDFDPTIVTTATLAPLPDGLFLGLFINGGMRIAIEPPLFDQEAPDPAAMAEEAELGATYVRQQFRGAQVERAVIAGPVDSWPETEAMLVERLAVPVERLDINGLSAASLMAFGAILDSRSAAPLSLGGRVAHRKEDQRRATLRQTSFAAVAAVVVVAAWTTWRALDARRAHEQLLEARGRVERLAADVGPLRQTADQRRLVRDATQMLRLTSEDRSQLQAALAAISGGVVGSIRMDSLHLERGSEGWIAALAGRAAGTTSGTAVQVLHDFYRDLPRRLVVEDLALGQMTYIDTTSADGTAALIRFEITFALPGRKDQ